MTSDAVESADVVAASAVHALIDARLTIGVAESLTGGLLAAALISVPRVRDGPRRCGRVRHRLKHSLLESTPASSRSTVPCTRRWPCRWPTAARRALAIDGLPADVGIATTGVAGPDPQDGQAVGTVFVGIVTRAGGRVVPLTLDGGRQEIRHRTVELALEALVRELGALE